MIFLVSTFGEFFALALLLHFLLQWLRVPARKQLSAVVAALTS